MAMETWDDFEDNDLSEWNDTSDATTSSAQAYSGSYSMEVLNDPGSAVATRTIYSGGDKPSEIRYWSWESSNSTGHGIRLVNSNGNYECGVACDNPEWNYSTGSSTTTEFSTNGEYSTWTQVVLNFDWPNNNVDISFDTGTNTGSTGWVSLGAGIDIETVEVWGHHSESWGQGNDSKDAYIDYIERDSPTSPPNNPENVQLDVLSNDNLEVYWEPPSSGDDPTDYDIDLLRDGGTWENAHGQHRQVTHDGSASYTYNVVPDSDNLYGEMSGLDSSFKTRVQSWNDAGSSGETYSGVKYTDPIEPHDPKASRPNGDTVDLSWTNKSDVVESVEVQYKEDTGTGYGSWTRQNEPHISLDGNNDRIEIPDSSSLDIVNNFTLAVKVTHNTTGDYNQLTKEKAYEIGIDGTGNLRWALYTSGGWEWHTSTISITTGTTHWVFLTYDGTEGRFYLDGSGTTWADTDPNGGNLDTNTRDVWLGARAGGDGSGGAYLDGDIHEAKIFDRVLSTSEIDTLASDGSVDSTGLVADWKCDNGSGSTVTDYAGTNNGTLYGGYWNHGGTASRSLTTSGVLSQDARYQFRLRNHSWGPGTSEWVYSDYGNSGKVFFEDDMEYLSTDWAGRTSDYDIIGTGYDGSSSTRATRNNHDAIVRDDWTLDNTTTMEVSHWVYNEGSGTSRHGGAILLDSNWSGYSAYYRAGDGSLSLWIVDTGPSLNYATELQNVTFTELSSGWYKVVLKKASNGDISGEIQDTSGTVVQSAGPVNDTTYAPTRPGIASYHNNREADVVAASDGAGNSYSDSFEVPWDTFSVTDSNYTYFGASLDGYNNSGRIAESSPPQGSYALQLANGDYVEKDLGDMSSESNVVLKAKCQIGSMDHDSENGKLYWYDGTNWQALRRFYWEYNKQGWFEVTALVPDSYLSTNNKIRLRGHGGPGDFLCLDQVVVSDILHEYTTPAAPSGLSVDFSVEDELTGSWTNNASFDTSIDFWDKEGNATNWNKTVFMDTTVNSETKTNLPDGVTYDVYVDSYVKQFRNGNRDGGFRNSSATVSGTTVFPGPTGFNVTSINDYTYDLGWTPNADNGTQDILVSTDGGATWTTDTSGLSNSTSSGTTNSYSTSTKHHLKVIAETSYTSKETSVIVESLAGNTIRRVNGALKTNSKGEVMTEW